MIPRMLAAALLLAACGIVDDDDAERTDVAEAGAMEPACVGDGASCADAACCDGAICVTQGTASHCLATCTSHKTCASGCCGELEDGFAFVCAPTRYCPQDAPEPPSTPKPSQSRPSPPAAPTQPPPARPRPPLPEVSSQPDPALLSESWYRWTSSTCVEGLKLYEDQAHFQIWTSCKLSEREFESQVFHADFVADARQLTLNPTFATCSGAPNDQLAFSYAISDDSVTMRFAGGPFDGDFTNVAFNDGRPFPLSVGTPGSTDTQGCFTASGFVPSGLMPL